MKSKSQARQGPAEVLVVHTAASPSPQKLQAAALDCTARQSKLSCGSPAAILPSALLRVVAHSSTRGAPLDDRTWHAAWAGALGAQLPGARAPQHRSRGVCAPRRAAQSVLFSAASPHLAYLRSAGVCRQTSPVRWPKRQARGGRVLLAPAQPPRHPRALQLACVSPLSLHRISQRCPLPIKRASARP